MTSVVVLGGSLAGLASALMLARAGHDVTILERDPSPLPADLDAAAGWARPTVPQTHQAHGFLGLARAVLLRRLPDVHAALLAAGAGEYWLHEWLPPTAAGAEALDPARTADLVALGCRRTTFEWVLRRAVLDQPGVDLRTGVVASGLLWRRGPVPHVSGVLTRGHGEVRGDVVLDATGRRSALPRWAAAGGAVVAERDEACEMTAYTRFFRVRDPATMPRMGRGNGTILVLDGCGAYAFLGDDDTVAVVLARSPRDGALARLSDPAVFDAAAAAVPPLAPWVSPDRTEPISGVAVMGGLRSTLRPPLRDGRPRLLGLHAVGDALATTNPAFGRGASLVLAHAEIVTDGLAAEPDSPARQSELIGHRLTDLTVPCWWDAVRHDRARTATWHATLGLPPARPPLPTSVPMPLAFAAAAVDAEVWLRVLRATSLLDQPGTVYDDPALAARIAELDPPQPPPPARRTDPLAALGEGAARRPARAAS